MNVRSTAAALCLALSGASAAHGQTAVQLSFGGSATFAAPTVTDYIVGKLTATSPLPFQVATTNEPAGTFTTTVSIRTSSATLGGGKPVADLEWRRGDDATWFPLTTNDAIVETRTQSGNGTGHTWSNTIYFRMALAWTKDPPATYVGNILISVTATP